MRTLVLYTPANPAVDVSASAYKPKNLDPEIFTKFSKKKQKQHRQLAAAVCRLVALCLY